MNQEHRDMLRRVLGPQLLNVDALADIFDMIANEAATTALAAAAAGGGTVPGTLISRFMLRDGSALRLRDGSLVTSR